MDGRLSGPRWFSKCDFWNPGEISDLYRWKNIFSEKYFEMKKILTKVDKKYFDFFRKKIENFQRKSKNPSWKILWAKIFRKIKKVSELISELRKYFWSGFFLEKY